MSLNLLFHLPLVLGFPHWKHYVFTYLENTRSWDCRANEDGPCSGLSVLLKREANSRPVSTVMCFTSWVAVGRTGCSGTTVETALSGVGSQYMTTTNTSICSHQLHGNPERQVIMVILLSGLRKQSHCPLKVHLARR